jgi:hypothetical protein
MHGSLTRSPMCGSLRTRARTMAWQDGGVPAYLVAIKMVKGDDKDGKCLRNPLAKLMHENATIACSGALISCHVPVR